MAQTVLSELHARGIVVGRLCVDSREIAAGDVFLAYPGARADGRDHVATAIERGAGAVLWERQGYTWPQALRVPNLPVDELRALSGPLAHLVCGRPSEKLWMVGVTGTNGKTSISQWVAAALCKLGRSTAVIGTIGEGFPGALRASANTTPEAVQLHLSLSRYLQQGATACAMEVSSIGLDQARVAGVRFAVAVLSNLSRDHLEYHRNMDAYAAAKARLFATPGLQTAVLNLDDAFGRGLAASLRGTGLKRVGYSLSPEGADSHSVDALVSARHVAATGAGLRFVAVTPQGEADIAARLVGRFNVANLLAVLAVLLEAGIPLQAAGAAIAELEPPPGRMQMQGGNQCPLVVVDYAHTPDALEQALLALRETAQARAGRLACVFGCGGDRDPGKRPEMGEVAARLADRCVLTSDNPRSEDPQAILEQIASGFGRAAHIVADRAFAITQSIAKSEAADVVLVAGKGHESYQEIAGMRLPFDDTAVAARALADWREIRK